MDVFVKVFIQIMPPILVEAAKGLLHRYEGQESGTKKRIKIVFAWLLPFLVGLGIFFIIKTNMPPKDEKEAFSWYLKKVENSSSSRFLNKLGECYFYGLGTAIDYSAAFSCFEKAAESSRDAQYHLAICYAYGYGTNVDDKKALKYFYMVEDSNIEAKAYIGYYNYCGWGGIEMDKDKAFLLLKDSKSKGSIMASYFQAIYFLGEKDVDRAIVLCEEAVEGGYEKAYGLLGYCYFTDSPVKDYWKAYDYFKLGKSVDSDIALYRLGCYYENGYGVVEKDKNKAIEYYKKSAMMGNVDANYRLGRKYYYGTEVECNYEQALGYLALAASRRHSDAITMMGVVYQDGSVDNREAFLCYEKAADLGNKTAQTNLAMCHFYGIGTEKNRREAFRIFSKLAEENESVSQYHLGICYENGYEVERDIEQAEDWYRKAAEQGYHLAENKLGWLLYNQGNYSEAFGWLLSAGQGGEREAQYGVGECFFYGRGITQNFVQAVLWYQKAAEQDYKKAIMQLGDICLSGYYKEANYYEAVQWYQKAADLCDSEGQYKLANCYKDGIGVIQDYSMALEWYQKAAEQNHAIAQSKLGDMYYYGLGTQIDYVQAASYFKKSAENGCASGQFSLGFCYQYGQGVQQDEVKAISLYTKAAKKGDTYAQYYLGKYYMEKDDNQIYGEQAFWWLECAAKQGNLEAQELLGKCYEDGIGVQADIEKANQCYKFAHCNSYTE